MNTTTASRSRYYISECPRGYAVVDDNGDGEFDWFPTYEEAADRIAELNDPEADR